MRQVPGAVDARRLDELVGHGEEELPAMNRPNASASRGITTAHGAVEQVQVDHDLELRHHDDLDRHHERADDEQEEHVAHREAQLGERVAGHEVDGEREEDREHRDDDGVRQPPAERVLAPGLRVVLPVPVLRPQRHGQRRQLVARRDGGAQHPVHGEHEDDDGDDRDRDAGQDDPTRLPSLRLVLGGGRVGLLDRRDLGRGDARQRAAHASSLLLEKRHWSTVKTSTTT